MLRLTLPLVMSLVVTACASLPHEEVSPPVFIPEPQQRYSSAVAALNRTDFADARPDLEWLVSRCEAGRRGRTALLLFASAELDARNPRRSPAEAARLAGAYLRLPWADPEELPLARTLYLMAVDLEPPAEAAASVAGPVPDTVTLDSLATDSSAVRAVPLAERFEHCDGSGTPKRFGSVPAYPGATTAERLVRLRSELDARADSLEHARTEIAEREKKIADLQAEIDRIRKLLKGGGGTSPIRP